MSIREEEDIVEIIKKKYSLDILGFDEVFDRLITLKNNSNYPHYNLEKINEEVLCITLAVAGFSAHELDVYLDGIQLNIKGSKEEGKKEYIYKGIASRSFVKSFLLSEGIEIIKANYENGLLQIYLKKNITKSGIRKIDIHSNDNIIG